LELGLDRAHHLDQLVLADRDERLLRRDRLGAVLLALGLELDFLAARGFLDALEEALHDTELDVAFEQRQPHVVQRLLDDGIVELGDPGQLLTSRTESFGKSLQHGTVLPRQPRPSGARNVGLLSDVPESRSEGWAETMTSKTVRSTVC